MSKTNHTLALRLKAARERNNMSQQDLADVIGTSRESIQHIEDGRTKNPRKLEQIAKALDVSPAWLRFGNEKIDKLDADSLEVAQIFNGLDDQARAVALATLKALKKG